MNNHLKQPDDELVGVISMIRNKKSSIDVTDQVMSRIYKHQSDHKGKVGLKKNFKVTTIIVTTAFMIMVGSAFVSPTMADSLQQVPGMKGIFKIAGDLGLKVASEQNLMDTPNVSVVHDNTTYTVPELIFDGSRVTLSIERSKADSDIQYDNRLIDAINKIDIKINGRDLRKYDSDKGSSIGIFLKPGATDDSTFIEFSDLRNQKGIPFPDAFELTLSFNVEESKDPLLFTIPVVKNNENIIEMVPNETRTHGIYTLTISKIELSPVTTNITTKLSLTGANDSLKTSIDYDVFDEKGNQIKVISGNGSGGDERMSDMRFEPFTTTPEKLIIKPYQYEISDKKSGQFVVDENGEAVKHYIPELDFEIPIEE
ncbi:DUF4179 domain-containing protein [Paenibacillus sp. EC2-1]|uniref:DUF4179 domain-containing protein n=1 Tax=Paenibacillus sp. EC2-1 TaxID=3388665 RepID=UPI003BEF3078